MSSPSFATLADLPAELYASILDHVPISSLQYTTAALLHAVPRAPIPLHYLYTCVRLRSPKKVVLFYQHLLKYKDVVSLVRMFSLETWEADAEIVVNLMELFPQDTLREIVLFIGPKNFAPEHLQEIFRKPRYNLLFLSLRFRPYVQTASYYSFHKGAYFDSTIFALSTWDSHLPYLSVVQDPLDPSIAPSNFAQPIVFFRLDPLSHLSTSELGTHLRHFRLRVPDRSIARYITDRPGSLMHIECLDLSTCRVNETEAVAILGRFAKLTHLLLDGPACSIVSHRTDMTEEERRNAWAALGKVLALSGVRLAKEREKKIKAYLERIHAPPEEDEHRPIQTRERRPRRGRRGLATATISLRESPPTETNPLPPLTDEATSLAELRQKLPKRVRVLPPQPFLSSLCVSVPGSHRTDVARQADSELIRAEFERGWAEGLALLTTIRARLMQTWPSSSSGPDSDEEGTLSRSEEGLDGMVVVEFEETFLVREDKCPVLCLAGGSSKDLDHAEGCGHRFDWEYWQNEL
ncbi:hypothetical protein K474DRAFT_1652499 [Panus rudis PR-1116 ss-1]|nr:hypothetical protein K474DRAFT_1652499 [Panus rudis PR-1116 ss-1]